MLIPTFIGGVPVLGPPVDGSVGQALLRTAGGSEWGTIDLSLYALLAGRATPQIFAFGTLAGATAGKFTSTSHATKGSYSLNAAGTMVVDELNGRVGLGVVPQAVVHIKGGNDNQLRLDNDGSRWTSQYFYNNGNACSYISWSNSVVLGFTVGTIGTTPLLLATNSTPFVKLDEAGKLGINKVVTVGAQLHVCPNAAGTIGQIIQLAATPTANAFEINSNSGSGGDLANITKDGDVKLRTPIIKRNALPADSELANSQLAIWLDSTAGATKIMFKAKDSAGTVRVGEVALA